jgi:ABC-type nitrate/sulfonate/bicarbonate transport system substrate-binding protein
VFTVNGTLLDEHPELIARWLARSIDAAEWASEHREEARRFIAANAGLPEELVDTAYSPEVHEQLGIDLDGRSVEALKVQKRHLLEHGFLARDFDVEQFIDPAPLAAAHALRSRQPQTVGA